MQFDELYNLILQSIITQNGDTRRAMILKSNIKNKDKIIMYLISVAAASSNKIADFLCKFFVSGQIKDINDQRIQQIIDILQRNTNYNTQTNISLKDFLAQNQKYINRNQASDPKYLDSIPEFYDKEEYSNGVVVYKVQDTKEGMEKVRAIIDAQWGYAANPWCLVARNGQKNSLDAAWDLWRDTYNAYPKQIAFQKGKLLAFNANSTMQTQWWDRNDKPTDKLKLQDGSFIDTTESTFTSEQTLKRFLNKNSNLVLNQQTGRYDSNSGDVYVQCNDIIDNHLPVKFGVIKGNFHIEVRTSQLNSLQGCPIEVGKNCRIEGAFTTLKGAPRKVGKSFCLSNTLNLESLEGSPEYIGGWYRLNNAPKIRNLEGITQNIQHGITIFECDNLQNLNGLPNTVKDDLCFYKCNKLINLNGCSDVVLGNLQIDNCQNLVNLKGSPSLVAGSLFLLNNNKLESLKEGPKELEGSKIIRGCSKLKDRVS